MLLYNTATRTDTRVEPAADGLVRVYCCGPTVYNYAHIGNLRTYIFEDTLVRSLRLVGYQTMHVMNITDVGHLQSDADDGEDKLALASARERRSPWEIAKFYEAAFFSDCRALNILRPDIVCRATEHIPDMIEFVALLLDRNFAYAVDGNVYFEVSKFDHYNEIRGEKWGAGEVHARVDADPRKRSQDDFVLWFSQSKFPGQIMKWDSPWGTGFPGWHIECSAMATKYLGGEISIHCGGIDHIAIHHTNENAQSCCYHGHSWVKIWSHAAFLGIDTGKMSKSQGGNLLVSTLVEKGFSPLHFRYLCLTTHYRSELKFSWESLGAARSAYERLLDRVEQLRKDAEGEPVVPPGEAAKGARSRFIEALSMDLNTASAVAGLWTTLKDKTITVREKLWLCEVFDDVLGLDLLALQERSAPPEVLKLLKARESARGKKEWARADEIRQELEALGVSVRDTAQGTEWTLSREIS